ncbi:MAG TPA: HYR domain-containing protein [Thermoanaerobaculia bacterium]|nr:HYR domain-containing protein [Thermoanaerobaculia bacterium]
MRSRVPQTWQLVLALGGWLAAPPAVHGAARPASIAMPAVAAVVSPPLRDVKPIVESSEVKFLVENHEVEIRFPLPARPPADGALQAVAGRTALRPVTAGETNAPNPSPGGTPVNFDGTPVNNGAPPDSDGRVGPNHYIQFVNTRFQIWDKAGHSLYGPFLGKTLWQFLGGVCAVHNDGDPVAAYDILADRWILTQFTTAVPAGPDQGSHQCFAISKTGDPLGAYYLYDFRTSTDPALFEDYPHLAVWPDGYYMTTHEFKSNSFAQENLYVLERAAILAGMPARLVVNKAFDSVNFGIGALPSDLDGLTPPPAGSPNYVVRYSSPLNDNSTNALDIWKASATWPTDNTLPTLTVTGPTVVPVSTFNDVFSCFAVNRACIAEPLNPATPQDYLDVVGDRIMFRNAYRNFGDHESLVLNHTVNVAAAGSDQAAVRWYELRNPGGASPSLFQQGTYSPTDVPPASRWMGSIAMDGSGNIALGYTKSSPQIFPTPMITGRLAGDPLGTMGSEIVMFAGAGSQIGTGNRWGDYSAMSVDPRDGCTFWYTSQYLPATGSFNWHMRIAAFRFPGNACSPPPQGTLQGTVTNCTSGVPLSDAVVTLDNGFSGATDAAGHYSIVSPPGTYNATPASQLRSCTAGTPTAVTISDGAATTQNFCLDGLPKYVLLAASVDDSSGNNNGILNRGECDNLNVTIENVGCHDATGVSATLGSVTSNLTLATTSSTFPDLAIGQSKTESTPYAVSVGSSYVCGTPAVFSLAVTDAQHQPAGTVASTLGFSLPTCGPANSPIVFANQTLTAGSSAQVSRLGRDGAPSDCSAAKTCPGPLASATGNRFYNAHQLHTPPGTAPVCVSIKVDAHCGSGNEIFSAAYSGLAASYDNTKLCGNYLGDVGVTGLGDTAPSATYNVVVPPDQDFFVVVDTINSPTETCSGSGNGYTVTVSGYYDTSTFPPQLTLACPSPAPVCAPPGAQSTVVTYPSPTVSGNCGASATPSCLPPSGSSFNVGSTQVNCSVTAGQTAHCSFTQVVAPTPDSTIAAPAFVQPGSTGNVASVPEGPASTTYTWSIANGTITGGAGTRQITFTAGTFGSVALQVEIQSGAGCGSKGSTSSVILAPGQNFYTLTPCRVVDTRNPNGAYGGPALAGGAQRSFAIGGQCGVPADAKAVAGNVTAVNATAAGDLRVFAAGIAAPGTSNLNFAAGQVRANNLIVSVAGNPAGSLAVLLDSSGTSDFILDVNGYFK